MRAAAPVGAALLAATAEPRRAPSASPTGTTDEQQQQRAAGAVGVCARGLRRLLARQWPPLQLSAACDYRQGVAAEARPGECDAALAGSPGDVDEPRRSNMELVRRSKNFSVAESDALITLWSDPETQKKFDSAYRHSVIWEMIANKLRMHGYERSSIDCKTKINNLKATYFKFRRIYSAGYPVEWPHWQKLHAILGKRPVPHSWNNYYDDERTSESRISRTENGSMHYDEPEIEFPEFRAGDLQFQNLQPISRLPIAPKREPIEDITLEPEVNICYDNEKCSKRKSREDGEDECEQDPRKKRKEDELDLLRRILKVEEETLELEKKRAQEEAEIMKATMNFLEAATSFMQRERSERPRGGQATQGPSTARAQTSSGSSYCNGVGGLPVVGAPLYTTQPSFYSSSPVDSPGKTDP